MKPKLLATDLDGTLFEKKSNKKNLVCLKEIENILIKNKIKLVFVSGRDLKLVLNAIKKYSLPVPKAILCNVGTQAFFKKNNKWIKNKEWNNWIKEKNPSFNAKKIEKLLKKIKSIKRQEKSKQAEFKQSYYIDLNESIEKTIQEINSLLEKNKIKSKIIFSVDFINKIGLIDVLPEKISKHAGVGFIRRKLNYSKKQVIVSGDSGNDLDLLFAGYNSILVGNALLELKNYLLNESKKNNLNIYFSKNFAACGVIEGLNYFLEEK